MKQLEPLISPLIPNQLPDFYKEYGPNFISFVQAYYEWLELDGNVTNVQRNLMTYRDVDTTIDQFISNFKKTYLQNFPEITASDPAFIIKHIKDYYYAKGSAQSIKLLFLLLFGEDAEIYNPNEYILRASDGNWILPQYIELDIGDIAKTYVGKIIHGSQSGASAFVDGYIRKRIKGRFVDVLFLSGTEGKFVQNEVITDVNGNLSNAPKIIGSLTTLEITNGCANNQIGDLYTIQGTQFGIDGLARVSATVDGTGKVLFTLNDGGTGYTLNANVYVSNVTALYSNLHNSINSNGSFTFFEQVVQPIENYPYNTLLTSANGFTVGQNVYGYTTGGLLKANGFVIATNPSNTTSGILTISVTGGDFALSNNIQITGNTTNARSNGGIGWVNATGVYLASNSTEIGIINTNNQFYAN